MGLDALLASRLLVDPREIPNPRHYNIEPDSTGWDVGAYKGGWTRDFRVVSEGSVHLYEPHPAHFTRLVKNMADITGTHLHECGLGARTHDASLSDANDGSSLYANGTIAVKVLGIEEAARKHGLPTVMKINVEGAEYDILETMLAHGLVGPVRLFLIQFHKTIPRHEERRKDIQERLAVTHECLIDRPFVWEAWRGR